MTLPPPLVSNSFVKAHKCVPHVCYGYDNHAPYLGYSSILLQTDGVIAMGPEALEPDCAAAFRKWLGERSTPVYFAGPLLPEGEGAAAAEKGQSPLGIEIQAFLDRELQTRGENSILYVSSRLS